MPPSNSRTRSSCFFFCRRQAHLSEVYRSRSKVNNDTPRSVAQPPPWANLDPRVLSPIPNKKKREARWDSSFAYGDHRPAGEGRGISGSRRSATTTTRRRPASAGARQGHDDMNNFHRGAASGCRRRSSRPVSATVRGRDARNWGGLDVTNGVGGENVPDGGRLSTEGRDDLDTDYVLDEEQRTVFDAFVDMLTKFDTCSMVAIIDNSFREAQLTTGLQNFSGCGDD